MKWDSSRGYHSDTENDDFDGVNETDEENESDEIVNVYERIRRLFEAAFFEHSRWINEAVLTGPLTFNEETEDIEDSFMGYLKFLYRLTFISFSMIFNATIMSCLIVLALLAFNICIFIGCVVYGFLQPWIFPLGIVWILCQIVVPLVAVKIVHYLTHNS